MNKKILASLLLPLSMAATPLISQADVSISVSVAPPVLPVYAQPVCPGDGYIWTPGYWAWDGVGYYWVPGTWVFAPRPGYLWTPGWWGWNEGLYIWHAGYWGPHVGFYGGVNYGYGYGGRGYEGGRWNGDRFYYNRTVNNVNVTNIHNTYNTTVVNNVTVNRVSFNGGNGGTRAQPNAQERNFERESHLTATADQTHHEETARSNPALSAARNHGHPAIAATPRPGAFDDRGVVPAKAAGSSPRAADSRTDDGGHAPNAAGRHDPRGSGESPAQPAPHPRQQGPQSGDPRVDGRDDRRSGGRGDPRIGAYGDGRGDARGDGRSDARGGQSNEARAPRPPSEPSFQQARPPQRQEQPPRGPSGPRPETPRGESPRPPHAGSGNERERHG